MEDLLPLVYNELRRIAARELRGERPGHTLCTTALVHEAWLELAKLDRIQWQNRSHYLALAAQAMRRVLIDHAVARRAQKRGGGRAVETLDEDVLVLVQARAAELWWGATSIAACSWRRSDPTAIRRRRWSGCAPTA